MLEVLQAQLVRLDDMSLRCAPNYHSVHIVDVSWDRTRYLHAQSEIYCDAENLVTAARPYQHRVTYCGI